MTISRLLQKFVLFYLLSICTVCSYAANPCALEPNGGIGGTGLMPDSGIGGTGLSPEGGIGGTGHAPEDGIGGTGMQLNNGVGGTGQRIAVIGVVTGFASVCVNGVEVHYDDSTSININGQSASPAQLMVGQIVSISADHTPKGWNASSIHSNDAVSGPVTRVIGHNRVEVAGQTIHLPQGNIGLGADKFAVGQHVRVQGVRVANGEVLATSATRTTRKEVIVTGTPEKQANGTLTIGRVKLGNLTPKNAENGQPISVSGRLVGNSLQVSSSRPALQIDARANQLSIQSAVISSKDGQLQLSNGIKVLSNRNINPGALVQINAVKNKEGVWQSTSVNNQSHNDLMKRAGERQDNSGKNSGKSTSDDNKEVDESKSDSKADSHSGDNDSQESDDHSGSSNSDDKKSGSNSGSSHSDDSKSGSNSGSSNDDDKSGSNSGSNSGSSKNEIQETKSGSNSGSNSGSGKIETQEIKSGSNGGSNQRLEVNKPEVKVQDVKVDRVEKPSGSNRVERIETAKPEKPSGGDRPVRVDRPSGGDRVRSEVRESGRHGGRDR